MLRRTYDRLLALAASPTAPWWLALVSFAEASFFPIPPDAMLIPMSLARPRAAWTFSRIEPYGFFIVLGLVVAGVVGTVWLRPLISWGYSVLGLLLTPLNALLS